MAKRKAKPKPKRRASSKPAARPAHQAGASPRNGVVPPAEHRFKPGQSGNPKGRPAAGAAVREWLDVMQDWTADKIEQVLADPKAPMHKRVAARVWKHAACLDLSAAETPIAGAEFDRIMDRTEGKARQRLELEVEHKQPDVLSDAQYVAFALAKGIAADKWVPGVRARYEAGMVPGYPKKEKKR